MNRVRTLLVSTAAATLTALAAPIAANATTYCVNDAACVSGGGTDAGTFANATTLVNALGNADVIRVGAGAYVMPALQTFPNGSPVQIVGAGEGLTTITGATVSGAISIGDPGSSISSVSLVNGSSASTVLTVQRGAARDLTVTSSASNAAIAAYDGAVVERVTVTTTGVQGVSIYAGAGTTTTLRESTVTNSATGASVTASGVGATHITRSTLRGQVQANFSAANQGTTELTDSIVRSSGGAAVLFSTSDTGGAATGTGRVRNVTIIGMPGGTVQHSAISASTFGGTGNVATTNVDVQGVVVWGTFDQTLRTTAPDNNVASITVATSDIDLSADHIVTSASGTITNVGGVFSREPGFVDAAAGDFRPRAGSPLIDAGPTTPLLASQNGTTIGGGARTIGARTDIGALEYAGSAPTGIATVTPTLASGASGTATVTASDPDPGEGAQLTYAWRLPDGTTATGTSVTVTAPDAPGTYTVAVTITDPTGRSTSTTATFVVPVERVAPKLTLKPTATTRKALLKRSPLQVATTTNERASATVVLSVTVTTTVRGRKRTRSVKLGTAMLATDTGTRTASITPTAAATRTLAALLKVRGAKVTWIVTGTATDPSMNTGVARATARVR